MSAYIIVDVTVTNEEQYADYRKWSTLAIQAHEAEVLVRGGRIEVLEGAWQPTRIVVLKFPTADQARAFYDSQEYRRARTARENAADMRMVLVEGV
ncbi:DUF1330 domain-containing protein [Eleftheria terrae]|uniref:DUF1330 domain-containing protein n=1 Tax=Eleftheria terrae TaxID=1597781 RepID=UPI00263AC538|nr:DUF1330 domain-containing protein [Eleftheria terrae]WKB53995.1 DUF1330 domain-containing protein [Eleftheria terrae]